MTFRAQLPSSLALAAWNRAGQLPFRPKATGKKEMEVGGPRLLTQLEGLVGEGVRRAGRAWEKSGPQRSLGYLGQHVDTVGQGPKVD